ncbi:hypothetical protein GO730_26110 [Spirosoma sp. HMF3257]|uniref:Peptidase C39-like domain-containing protein n=1 Tax=Spirosoma telluris TaxID=2183553 RepID=A0A327NVA8_9BACT|nr:hypothetical protein [Spirosoma telluris]RAI76768.1 hypothetical protein HMF3257_26040 [Spirosoma telluris]
MANTIYYYAKGELPVIAQPTSMSCWATVNTMMLSWRDQQSYSIETVMDWLGSDFRQIYDNNSGLPGERNNDWASANGMRIEYERCETPESIFTLLTNHGPLIVIDDQNNGITDSAGNRLWCIHARIIVGIDGDADNPDGVYIDIIDPDGGNQYQESFTQFEARYEAMTEAENYQILMMHY